MIIEFPRKFFKLFIPELLSKVLLEFHSKFLLGLCKSLSFTISRIPTKILSKIFFSAGTPPKVLLENLLQKSSKAPPLPSLLPGLHQ